MPLLFCPTVESLYEVSVHMLALPGHPHVSSLQGPLRVCPLLSRMMWESWLQVSPASMPTLTNAQKKGIFCADHLALRNLVKHNCGMQQPSLSPAISLQVSCSLQRKTQHCPLELHSSITSPFSPTIQTPTFLYKTGG